MVQGRIWCVLGLGLILAGCGEVDPLGNLERRDVGMPGTTDMSMNNDVREDMGGEDATPDMMEDETPDMPDTKPPVDQHEVTVATFNVKRLFDDNCDSGQCDSGDFEEVISELSLKSKIDRLQRAIERIDADVIVFQEVETREVFDRMISTVRNKYPTREFGELGFSASLDVGIISKLPKLDVRRHRSRPIEGNTRFAREFLEVHVNHAPSGRRVVVFGAHFISKRGDNDARRQTEGRGAARISKATRDEFPNAFVIVAGDLNDNPGTPTLMEMTGAGMTNAVAGVEDFYTFVFAGMRQTIDHLLYWDRNGFGHQDVEALHDDGRTGLGGSDHGAARVTFTIAKP